MNIALILEQTFDPDAGGVQRSTSKLAIIFKNKGHHVILISTNTKSPQIELWNGISIYGVDTESKTTRLKEIIKEEKISLVINQAGYSYPLTKFLKKNLTNKTKIVNTLRVNPLNFVDNYKQFVTNFLLIHNLGFINNFVSQKIILWYHIFKQRYELNYIIKNTSAFIMLSDRFKSELYSLAPNLTKYDYKIYGIGNPFVRPQIDIEKTVQKKENVILFVGRIDIIQKRVDLLLEIWKQLHENLPDWKFWVVGDGESKQFMEYYCSQNKLDRVVFFGKDNPTEYYKKAKLFHLTSAFEGFGNVLVEAQSHGCVPIMFNSYSAAADIINNNANGILVIPYIVKNFINQTEILAKIPKKLNKMAFQAYDSVSRFSYEETYKKWERIFDSLQ